MLKSLTVIGESVIYRGGGPRHAPTAKTRDEIRFHHLPTSTGYYLAYRAGENRSCVLAGRTFGK